MVGNGSCGGVNGSVLSVVVRAKVKVVVVGRY